MRGSVMVSGVSLDVVEKGQGRPLLFLHPGEGLWTDHPWIDQLAMHHRVIAPHHPGFGGSALPDWMGSVDDLAYLYLDLAERMQLRHAVLAGNSFGGWIAAEMAIRNTRRFAGLFLASPLGIKVGGVLDRDIVDMHAVPRADLLRLAWADPAKGEVDFTALPDTELAAIARGREALAVFGWKPYMHNPRLKRWLHRIDIPTALLWGEQDGIVARSYVEAWSGEIDRAEFETLPHAGHFPHLEQPAVFAERVRAFTTRL